MSNLSKYGDITSIQQEYANRKFLSVFQPATVTQRFGMADSLPKHNTKTMTWKKYANLTVTTAPVAEGITPESVKLTVTTVSCILQQYIYVMELTDVVGDTHEDPVLMMMTKRIGQAMSQTIEKVTIASFHASTNVYFANGSATTDVNTVPTRGLFRQVARGFFRNLAQTFTEIISATAKVSTTGIESAYFAMCHTDLDSDLRNMTGWVGVVEYSSVEKRVAGEIGSCEKMRFITSTNFTSTELGGDDTTTMLSEGAAPVGTVKADIYPIFVVAKESYGIVRLQGKGAVETFVLNPGTARGGDPAAQRGSVANKVMYGSTILNQLWMAKVWACATASL